jgi:hypothetical protein
VSDDDDDDVTSLVFSSPFLGHWHCCFVTGTLPTGTNAFHVLLLPLAAESEASSVTRRPFVTGSTGTHSLSPLLAVLEDEALEAATPAPPLSASAKKK